MKTLQLLLADRLNGGVLAALLSYALLFQSVAGGIASARATEAQSAAPAVICTASGPVHRDPKAGHRLHECCAVLCQVACGSGAGLLPDTGGAGPGQACAALLAAPAAARPELRSPRRLGIRREARAPPHLSA